MLLRVSPPQPEIAVHDFADSATASHAIHQQRLWLLTSYERLGVLEDFQMRATLFWCRVLYGLLSLCALPPLTAPPQQPLLVPIVPSRP